jgi:hypothetical protein
MRWGGRWRWLAMLVAGLLASCTPPTPAPERVLLANNFEQAPPANVAAGAFSSDYAHSLSYSVKVGSETEFYPLGQGTWAALHRPRHLRLHSWAWLPDAQLRTAHLVVQANRPSTIPGKSATVLSRNYLNLCEVIRRYRKWEPATFFVSLPRELLPTDEISFFVWVPTHQGKAVYIDDFCVEIID